MKLSKRQFLKLGLGGTAVCVLTPLFKPVTLLASPLVTPASYLNSQVHGYWMRLSYNGTRESRQVRRSVGAALRNIGAIKGTGRGYDFTLCFDKAVKAAFVRWTQIRQKPDSLFGLVRMLYDDFIYPELGVTGGVAMFGVLLGILRGLDGTAGGDDAHAAYLAYRAAALNYKDAARTEQDPLVVEQFRAARKTALAEWQAKFFTLVEAYATKQAQLDPQFVVTSDMIEGFHVYVNPKHRGPARLGIRKTGNQVVIRYQGDGLVQAAPTPEGPWTNTRKVSPAAFDVSGPGMFFRTIP